MSRLMLIAVLIILGGVVSASAQEISDEELLAHMKARYAVLNNREMVFRTRYYHSHAGIQQRRTLGIEFELPDIPEGRPTEPPDELVDILLSSVGHHRVALSDGKIRTERLAEVDPRNEGGRIVRTWDGIEARGKGYDSDGEETALWIAAEPDNSFFTQGFGTWLGMWLFSSRDVTPDAIFRSASEKERRVDGEVTIWTFHPPIPGAGEIEIMAVRDPAVRITSVTRRSYYRDENRNPTSLVRFETRIEFDRNAPKDDMLLSHRARLTTKSYQSDGTARSWAVETFELESIEPLGELPDDFFRLSAENETVLHIPDSRPMIAEMLADRERNVGEGIEKTEALLEENVDENRADPVERREQEFVNDEPRAEASHPSRTSSPPAMLWWIAGGMMGVGFIGIVLWIVTRSRR